MSDLLGSIEGRRRGNVEKIGTTITCSCQLNEGEKNGRKAYDGGKNKNEEGLDLNLLLSSLGVDGAKSSWFMIERAGDETGVASVEED